MDRLQIFNQVLGGRIRLARQFLELSATELGQKVELTPQQVIKYEAGQSRVSAARLLAFSEALDRPIEWFYKPIASVRSETLTANSEADARVVGDLEHILSQGDAATRDIVAGLLARFSHQIPRQVPEAAPVWKRRMNSGRRRILLVDDDPDVLTMATKVLHKAGYEVVPVGDAQSALAVTEQSGQLAAIVTDYSMPGMNGATLLAAVARNRPTLPAIMITGFEKQALTETISDRVEILPKPFPWSKLLLCLKHLEEQSKSRDAAAR